MGIQIQLLSTEQEEIYESFLYSMDKTLIYSSLVYRNFLRGILDNTKDYYLLAYENSQLVGVLPFFIKYNTQFGNIANSLPFYGSNGGLLISEQVIRLDKVRIELIQAFNSIVNEESVIAHTLISSPLDQEEQLNFYSENLKFSFQDERIGQIVYLPSWNLTEEDLDDHLKGLYHQKTRNCVRKAEKAGIKIDHSSSLEMMQFLFDIHYENITAVGGMHKPLEIFQSIYKTFEYDKHYRVYTAHKNDVIVAALLVFFYNQTAEYYTPVTKAEFRIDQPMSLLIHSAMKDATKKKCKYWNWGGTWLSQTGVYQFKKRWGTHDLKYNYYTNLIDNSILNLSKEDLLREYPYFYVLPFSALHQ
jgi:hypothetical protein